MREGKEEKWMSGNGEREGTGGHREDTGRAQGEEEDYEGEERSHGSVNTTARSTQAPWVCRICWVHQ